MAREDRHACPGGRVVHPRVKVTLLLLHHHHYHLLLCLCLFLLASLTLSRPVPFTTGYDRLSFIPTAYPFASSLLCFCRPSVFLSRVATATAVAAVAAATAAAASAATTIDPYIPYSFAWHLRKTASGLGPRKSSKGTRE